MLSFLHQLKILCRKKTRLLQGSAVGVFSKALSGFGLSVHRHGSEKLQVQNLIIKCRKGTCRSNNKPYSSIVGLILKSCQLRL